LDQQPDAYSVEVRELSESDLPAGDVTIGVRWSSVNYKDGLACITGNRVITAYPMTPGVDLAGTVIASSDTRFAKGDEVMVGGFELGTGHAGGFAELARVPGDWVMHLPTGLSAKEAMAIGTAGLTSALSIEQLEHNGLRPENGTVIVTGATGGVGSTAVAMLAQLGYRVAGSTGKASEHDFLRELGAVEVLSREEVSAEPERPLEHERWAGAVDPVGGATTAYLVRTTKYGGSVAVSGLTGGSAFSSTVFPFILRGVNLLGIEVVRTPMPIRERLWQRLARDLKPRGLMESIAVETDLDGVAAVAADIRAGRVRGRTLVRLAGDD
jgi:putative YhdH/YhfP family quinone oxidoreductase